MLTETTAAQDKLIRVFQLDRQRPPLGHRPQRPRKPLPTRQNTLARNIITGNSGSTSFAPTADGLVVLRPFGLG